MPLSQNTLPVQFGTPDHFRIEFVNFVVTDFEGTYHTIPGRPSLIEVYGSTILFVPGAQDAHREWSPHNQGQCLHSLHM